MSGIAGIINLDGRPVDRRLLAAMTDFMAYRGPDAKNIWIDENVGFGHALLRSTLEAENERQPRSLDGRVRITADARLDGRGDLIESLASKGQSGLDLATDAELILRAYHVWGEDATRHLLGDFAFAIWDADRKRLFCARDHFGVKPFYFAHGAGSFIFSNTLNCLRCHPAVSDDLNDQAIADFLLCGYNPDPGSSAFADIQRLPPAHTLQVALNTAVKSSRYWKLPVEKLIRYKQPDDYIGHFQKVFHQAVGDRLRTRRVGILMSGGLDSTSVAAAASRLLSKQFTPFDLHACTYIYEHRFKDEERRYSQDAADALGISISHVTKDDDRYPENVLSHQPLAPEPFGAFMIEPATSQIRRVASGFRVGLTGQGGDPALHPSPSPANLKKFLKSLVLERIALDIGRYRWSHGSMPRLGIRTAIKQYMKYAENKLPAGYPPWLNKKLAARLDLPGRSNNLTRDCHPADAARSQAYWHISSPLWTALFENYDPGVTRFPIELRHPFFDLRLLSFLLALPPVPWCVDKHILRKAMRDVLPESILNRPKTPLSGLPLYARLQQINIPDPDSLAAAQGFDRFIDIAIFKKMVYNRIKLRPDESEMVRRPLELALWLQELQNSKMEKHDGGNR